VVKTSIKFKASQRDKIMPFGQAMVGITGPPVTRFSYSRMIPATASPVSASASRCTAARISDIG
jgi:hypothetical protein